MKLRGFVKLAIVLGVAGAGICAMDLDDRIHHWWIRTYTPPHEREQAVWLPDYRVETEGLPIPGVAKNASGITFDPDRGSLLVVVNDPPKLVELDRDLQLIREITLHGFEDPEGVAYAGPGRFVVVDERNQSVVVAQIGEETTELHKNLLRGLTMNIDGGDNKGFEGVAVENEKIHIVRERDPRRVLTVSGLLDSEEHESLFVYSPDEVCGGLHKLDDFSGLHHDARSGNLLVLSHEDKTLVELNEEGKAVSFLTLRAGVQGLKRSIPQAEGVTIDDRGDLYIVSEPNLIYRYKRVE